MNLASLIEGHPADGRALFEGGRWQTWGEVRRRTAAGAAGLVGLGVGPGDRVAIAWPTSVDFVVAYLAVLAAGCVAVPLNPNSPAAEFGRELEVVTPAALLVGGAAARVVGELAGALSFSPVVMRPETWESLSAAAPRGTGAGGAWETGGAGGPGTDGGAFAVVGRDDGDTAVLLFTRGRRGRRERRC